MRVIYRQHKYNKNNVRQDRALSVLRQEVIHPIDGTVNCDLNLLTDTSNMLVHLNDIVRGEYTGRIVYKRNEVVENTDSDEKRLKFLFAWLSKHQRRIIGYSDDFYSSVVKVLDNYLYDPKRDEIFHQLSDLFQEVQAKHSYIQQARQVLALSEIAKRKIRGQQLSYLKMLEESITILRQLKFEIAKINS